MDTVFYHKNLTIISTSAMAGWHLTAHPTQTYFLNMISVLYALMQFLLLSHFVQLRACIT